MIPPRYGLVADLIRDQAPSRPVHLIRPHRVQDQARRFVSGFPGDVLYAVKCNAHPLVLTSLASQGINRFDVASPMEIARVAQTVPGAVMFYHHPAKTPEQIRYAADHGILFYAADHPGELDKLARHGPLGAIPMIRLAIAPGLGAVYDLSTKFGAPSGEFVALLKQGQGRFGRVGVTFHVGSQCLDPKAFTFALEQACLLVQASGVNVELMDLGGGFPAYYRTTQAPPLDRYFHAIGQAKARFADPLGIRLACEPGRALVAEGGSLLTRIILRKDRAVYLNDGIFGGLTEVYWGKDQLSLAFRVLDGQGNLRLGPSRPVVAWGPTCDGNDRLPYELDIPDSSETGDYIEFNLIGAYGREMAARYNGMESADMAEIAADFAGHCAAEARA